MHDIHSAKIFNSKEITYQLYDMEDECAEWLRSREEEGDFESMESDFPDFCELEALREAEQSLSEHPDHKYDLTLIADSHFEDYVRELVADCGYLTDFPNWIEIDWDQTAENVRSDYTEIEFDGRTFYYQ